MAAPKVPPQIVGHDVNGQIIHLFTKTISNTDMFVGLSLVGATLDYFRSWHFLHNDINGHGLEVMAYAPGVIDHVVVVKKAKTGPFKLKRYGWVDLCQQAGFVVGTTIHCWAVVRNGPNGAPAEIQLLFQGIQPDAIQPAAV